MSVVVDSTRAKDRPSLSFSRKIWHHSVLAQAAYTFIASQLLLKEQKAKIDEIFRVMDVSCDGKLSKQEVRTGYKDVFGCDISDTDVDEMFERST